MDDSTRVRSKRLLVFGLLAAGALALAFVGTRWLAGRLARGLAPGVRALPEPANKAPLSQDVLDSQDASLVLEPSGGAAPSGSGAGRGGAEKNIEITDKRKAFAPTKHERRVVHVKKLRAAFERGGPASLPQLVPVRRGGRTIGMEVLKVGRQSPLAQLGVQRGDILKKINGAPVRRIEDVVLLFSGLANANAFVVEVERAQSTRSIRYRVVR